MTTFWFIVSVNWEIDPTDSIMSHNHMVLDRDSCRNGLYLFFFLSFLSMDRKYLQISSGQSIIYIVNRRSIYKYHENYIELSNQTTRRNVIVNSKFSSQDWGVMIRPELFRNLFSKLYDVGSIYFFYT